MSDNARKDAPSPERRQAASSIRRHVNEDVRPIIIVVVAIIIAHHKVVQDVWAVTPGVIGLVLLVYFSLMPRAMRPLANGLIFLANHLGKINNRMVHLFLFFIILTPIGFLTRKLVGDRPDLKPREVVSSYF